MRVNLEGKGQAVDGDVTTTGAVCIATGAGYLDEGRMVLREGDHTTPCPLCGQVGTVAEGVDHFISDGQRVAMDGALVVCGCSPGSNRWSHRYMKHRLPCIPLRGLPTPT